MKKQRLAIPGPTNVPERVLLATARQPINHRGAEFKELLFSCTGKLRQIFQTESQIYILTASGTGAMQAAVANCFQKNERVLVLVNGFFGERFVQIANCNNLFVERMDFEWGKEIDLAVVEDRLRIDKNKMIKGVLFQYNETSTGVLNDAEKLLGITRDHGALSVVDAISGLITAPFYQDEWGADVTLSASQKGFMMPPGLSFISVSERARRAIAKVEPRDYYFSIPKHEDSLRKGQTPFTPAVNLLFGLSEALDMILEEGLGNCWERHSILMKTMREAVRALGLDLFVEDGCASPAITAIKAGRSASASDLSANMRNIYGIGFAKGQGKLAGKIFRIAHLGYVDEADILQIVGALESYLRVVGLPKLP